MSKLASQTSPSHIGIILDGNRRWAKSKLLPSLEGHRKGYDNLKEVSLFAFDKGVKYLSAYIFSTENWARTQEEISYLMGLALKMVTRDLAELHKKGVRVVWLGTPNKLSPKLLKSLYSAEETTKNNTAGTLALCFNYGGQEEIADAVKNIISKGYKAESITPELIGQYLYCPSLPPVDLLIRTSGEQRISNFMLWRIAYSELYFVKKMWPEFSKADLSNALAEYSKRARRFGK